MTFWVVLGGSLLSAVGTMIYLVDIIRDRVKPRIVTWLTWVILTGLAGMGALQGGSVESAVFALIGTAVTGAVVVVGLLRKCDRSLAKLDIVCMAGVLVGVALWAAFRAPDIAVWTSLIIDFVGLVPTFKHAWQRPLEETSMTYGLIGIGGLATVVAIMVGGDFSVTALGYPLYAAVSMAICVAIIEGRKVVVPSLTEAVDPKPFPSHPQSTASESTRRLEPHQLLPLLGSQYNSLWTSSSRVWQAAINKVSDFTEQATLEQRRFMAAEWQFISGVFGKLGHNELTAKAMMRTWISVGADLPQEVKAAKRATAVRDNLLQLIKNSQG